MPLIAKRSAAQASGRRVTTAKRVRPRLRDILRGSTRTTQRAFLDAVARARSLFDAPDQQEAIRSALADGDIERAFTAVPWERVAQSRVRQDIVGELRSAYEQAGRSTIGTIDPRASYAIADERLTEWVLDRDNRLPKEVTATVMDGIRETIRDGIERGMAATYRGRALLLRDAASRIGLLDREQRAVLNREEEMRTQGASDSAVRRESERYTRELLNARALRIARTEVAFAVSAGQRNAWEQAMDEGLVERGELVRVWSTAGSGDVCEECAALDGEEIPFDAVFSDGTQEPPLHPNCSCNVFVERR